jgi:hypothetical protein
MANLSTDIGETVGIWSLGGFRPDMPKVSGTTALLHRLVARLTTRRGQFPFWPNFGTRLSDYLLSKATPSAIAAAAQAECLKDEQVQSCQASAQVEDAGRRIRIAIRIVASSGPFIFTLAVTQARTDLIDLQQAA